MELNPVVLRNKGVPVPLFKVEEAPAASGRYEVVTDEEGNPEVEKVWIRFTANEVAEIEDRWHGVTFMETEPVLEHGLDAEGNDISRPTGETRQVLRTFNGLEGFEAASRYKPGQTYRDVIAIVLGREPRQVGAAMDPARTAEYQTAISGAWMMANGAPAETVGKALETLRVARERAVEALTEEAGKALEQAAREIEDLDTPGANGSPSGSETSEQEDSLEASTSSGA